MRHCLVVVVGVLTAALGSFGLGATPAAATAQRCGTHPPASTADYQAVPDARDANFGIGDMTSAVRLPDGRRFFTLGDTAYYNVTRTAGRARSTASATTRRGCNRGTASRCWIAPGPGARSWVFAAATGRFGVLARGLGRRRLAPVCLLHAVVLELDVRKSGGSAVAAFELPRSELARIAPVPFSAKRIYGNGAVYDGGYIYTYASQAATCAFCFAGDMYVARVPETRFRCRRAWRFRSGSSWTANPSAAKPVLRAAVSTTNVQRYGNGFLLLTKTFTHRRARRRSLVVAEPRRARGRTSVLVYSVPAPPPSFVAGFIYQQPYTYNSFCSRARISPGNGVVSSYNVNTFDPDEAQRDGRMTGPRFVSIPIPSTPPADPRPVVTPGPVTLGPHVRR